MPAFIRMPTPKQNEHQIRYKKEISIQDNYKMGHKTFYR